MRTIVSKQTFFKSEIFQAIGKELKRRYYLKGDFGSTIGLSPYGSFNQEPLRGLLGLTAVQWGKKQRISLAAFSEALQNSVFELSVTGFVELVTGENLVTKAFVEESYASRYLNFLEKVTGISKAFPESLTKNQLQYWLDKTAGNEQIFIDVKKALDYLPDSYTRIPVFAYQMTGDPHRFDDNRPTGQLLLQMLMVRAKDTIVLENLSQTEQKNEIYAQFYLLRDDIMNFVALNGLIAYRDGKADLMWQAACQSRHAWNAPLKELLSVEKIAPYYGNQVLVVENSGVYSILLDQFPTLPIICSNGQFRYAVWTILRKLVNSGVTLYYSGDMDPEGLVMADTVAAAFPGNVHFAAMNLKGLQKAKNKGALSETRLKKISTLRNNELQQLANVITRDRVVAYQEAFIEDLIVGIEAWLKNSQE